MDSHFPRYPELNYERESAIATELLPTLPEVEILIANERHMTFTPIPVWLDSAQQGAFMISTEHHRLLGSPKPQGTIKSITASGEVVSLPYVKIDVVFSGLKFFDVPAIINPALTSVSLVGWAILKHCHYGYVNGVPGLYYNPSKCFIFPPVKSNA